MDDRPTSDPVRPEQGSAYAEPSARTGNQGSATAPRRAGLDGFFDTLRGSGLVRDRQDKWLAGVCSGIAHRLGVDPILVRGGLIVLVMMGGFGILAYLIAWALMPDDDGEIVADKARHGDGWGITLLVVIGLSVVSSLSERWWLLFAIPAVASTWWAIRSANQGKSGEQMGQEANAFVQKLIGTREGGPVQSDPATTPAPGTASSPATFAPAATSPTPYGMGPGRTGAVTAATPLPPRIVRERRRRGGLLGLLLTAGLAVAGYGAATALAAANGWSGRVETIALAGALAGAGLGLLLIGAIGRRAGFTGFLVTLLAVVTLGSTVSTTLPRGGMGDRTWSAAAMPADGFQLSAGDADLSLAGATPGSTVVVRMGLGDLTVTVPADVTATVTGVVHMGDVDLKSSGQTTELVSGAGNPPMQAQTVGSGKTHVNVDVEMTAGQLTIVEAQP